MDVIIPAGVGVLTLLTFAGIHYWAGVRQRRAAQARYMAQFNYRVQARQEKRALIRQLHRVAESWEGGRDGKAVGRAVVLRRPGDRR